MPLRRMKVHSGVETVLSLDDRETGGRGRLNILGNMALLGWKATDARPP